MMLQIQMRQKSNLNFIKKIVFLKSLVAIFCTGLFAFNFENIYISNIKDSKLLLKPIDGLSDEQTDIFILGRSFFNIPWVKAPSVTTARDGLGPLFNANSCISCHPNNGRGELFNSENLPSRALLARLSIKSDDSSQHKDILKKKGFIPRMSLPKSSQTTRSTSMARQSPSQSRHKGRGRRRTTF